MKNHFRRKPHILRGPVEIHGGLPWQRCDCGQLHVPGSKGVTQAPAGPQPKHEEQTPA